MHSDADHLLRVILHQFQPQGWKLFCILFGRLGYCSYNSPSLGVLTWKKACRIMIVMIWLFAAYESSTSRLVKAKVLDYMQKSGCLWQVPLPNRGMNAGEYDGLDGLKCTILLVVVLLASEEGQAFLVSSLLLAGSCSLPSGRLLLPHDIMVNGRKSHVGWRLKTWWGS